MIDEVETKARAALLEEQAREVRMTYGALSVVQGPLYGMDGRYWRVAVTHPSVAMHLDCGNPNSAAEWAEHIDSRVSDVWK